jgi:glycolate oxidase FAD binding subunit
MNLSEDHFAQRLEAELGVAAVKSESNLLASHAVDGKQPLLFCLPDTPAQVAAVLRIGSESDAAMIPWGGGAAIGIGNLPRRVDLVIGLNRLSRLVEHDDANLTATLEAGMTLAHAQALVAPRNQFLPFDPPRVGHSTIGGIIAASLNGPRRMFYGSVRDLVIGMKVALVSGEPIKAGGKVVKNVAGYDMCKLFVGSLGTLGIITETTVRMAPIPETAATLIALGSLPEVRQLADEVSRSSLLPAAVVLMNSQAGPAANGAQGNWRVAVWSEGFEDSVARHLRDTQATAERLGLGTAVVREKAHEQLWTKVRDFPVEAERLVYRVTVPRGSVAEFVTTVEGWCGSDFHPAIVSDVVAGTVWISLAANPDVAMTWFSKLIAAARDRQGHAIILSAPPASKDGIDIWGSAPSSLSLMREIKRQFDPNGLLNPGRFVAGI